MKLQLIWDMDGTLVNSEPEILATIEKALDKYGLSIKDAKRTLQIGPPLPDMLRRAFTKEQLSDDKMDDVISLFRAIYDISDFYDTIPFEGIDDIIHSKDYVHHVITNKPEYATKRIIEKKGWVGCFENVFSPDSFLKGEGRKLNKVELFKTFRSMYNEANAVGIGDMAKDAECAKAIGIPTVGVLWGTGCKEELQEAGCEDIVSNVEELRSVLEKYCE